MAKTKQGWVQDYYKPKHPEKYAGDVENIFYRSSWERDAFMFLDNNPNVLRWSSEEIVIPYMRPTQSGQIKKSKYYPDIYMEYKDRAGKLCKELIEIKPKKQTSPSRSRNAKTKLYENQVYHKNLLKWEAADKWCKMRGIKFRILNEEEQFN